MNVQDFNAWLARMGWDKHGGQKLAAEALGVGPATMRAMIAGKHGDGRPVDYSPMLEQACASIEVQDPMVRHLLKLIAEQKAMLVPLESGEIRTGGRDIAHEAWQDTTPQTIARIKKTIADLESIADSIARGPNVSSMTNVAQVKAWIARNIERRNEIDFAMRHGLSENIEGHRKMVKELDRNIEALLARQAELESK